MDNYSYPTNTAKVSRRFCEAGFGVIRLARKAQIFVLLNIQLLYDDPGLTCLRQNVIRVAQPGKHLVCPCMHVCMCVFVCMYVHVCMYVYMYYVCMYVCI